MATTSLRSSPSFRRSGDTVVDKIADASSFITNAFELGATDEIDVTKLHLTL